MIKSGAAFQRFDNMSSVGAAEERQLEFPLQAVQFLRRVDHRLATAVSDEELPASRLWSKSTHTSLEGYIS